MLGVATGTGSALAGARRCLGCRRPDGAEVIAWKNGRWGFLTGTACYLFEPWGEPVEKEKVLTEQLGDTGFRTLIVRLNEGGLCPRCAAAFPKRPRRGWR